MLLQSVGRLFCGSNSSVFLYVVVFRKFGRFFVQIRRFSLDLVSSAPDRTGNSWLLLPRWVQVTDSGDRVFTVPYIETRTSVSPRLH